MHKEKREPTAGEAVVLAKGGRRRYIELAVSVTVLILGLVGSRWLNLRIRKTNEHSARVHFEYLTREAQTSIQRRVMIYANAMRAGRAVFNADPLMTGRRWRSFVETLDVHTYYPGIRGFGIVYVVPSDQAEEFAAKVRGKDRADFAIRSKIESRETDSRTAGVAYITAFIEPEDLNDTSLLGHEITDDVNRREAAERARDIGSPVLTNRVELTREGVRRSGLVIYLPLYDPEMPISTVTQRRRAIVGWVYVPLITEEFFASILTDGSRELELSFFEGNEATPENLLFATSGARPPEAGFERLSKLELAGHVFTLGWNRSAQFYTAGGSTAFYIGMLSALGWTLLAALVAFVFYTRRKATEALARQDVELAYQKFALDQHAIVAITDAAGTITYANDKFCAISGYKREELVGQNHRIVKSGVHPPDFFKQFYATISQGKVWQGEICNRAKNGQLSWMSATVVPFPGPDGRPEKYVAIRTDVTALRQTEMALQKVLQRLDLATEAAHIGVWDWDIESNTVLWDKRMFALRGVRPTPDGRVDYALWASAVHPDDLAAQEKSLGETVKSRTHGHREFRIFRHNDKLLRYIQAHEMAMSDENGKVTHVVGVNIDVTEAMHTKLALEASEERMRMFAEHVPASVAMLDCEMRFLVVSRQWLADYMLIGRNVIGRSYYEVLPDQPKHWRDIHKRCLSGAVETSLSEAVHQADGSVNWVQWEVRPWYTHDGNVGGIVMFTLDITSRREMETSMEKARDDALEASRLKSEFLATMSHEIRTPMNGVIGLSTLLAQTPLESRQREMALALANSAERLMVIINDILDFSKIEAGKMRIEPVDFNLRDLIEETSALMAATAHRKGLHLICDVDPGLAAGFSGDSGRIQQVMNNLVGNAVKFTEQGEVSIAAKVMNITEKICTFRISITDTGIGIPEAAKKRLFQPFMQADGSTTRRFGGTGLGLAISSQLVSLMGGNIGFESTEGKGSQFWFELGLPRAELPKVETSGKIPAEARVLVVDDHEVNRMVLMRQLATLQVPAGAATSAKEALAMLEGAVDECNPFSIVLLDWSMPEIDGLGLSKAIRANPKIASTCLIVLSSTDQTIEPSVSASLKFHAVLSKPVRENQLHRCLLRVYGRRATPVPFQRRKTLAGRGLKLLLAEDNPTNQLVAQLTLEQLGHMVTVAENGRVALDLLAKEPFDAVLMDCQMPEMDGFEATRQIRAGKVVGLNPQIPIIALTAFAMPADRVRVLESGMDDFVAKPLSKETLHAAFARCGLIEVARRRASTPPVEQVTVTSPVAADLVFDPTQFGKLRVLKTPGGGTVWAKVLGIFFNEMPARLESLSKHMAEKDAEHLSTAAHTIAGSAAIVGAPALRTAGLALEGAAKAKDWDKVASLLEAVLQAWSKLEPELKKTTQT